MTMDNQIKKYIQERDEILSEEPVDVERLRMFCEKHRAPFPTDPDNIRAVIHKMRVLVMSIPLALRKKSMLWLWDNDYSVTELINVGVDQ